jgi:prepilin signal peptidase PulO-like enzyme (type II secretory pathway)
MLFELTFSVFTFFLGTVVGSFLNVVIYRHEKGMTLGGRSRCPHCGKTIPWQELVPIFSFFILKGKCFDCKSSISIQYPIVEFLTAVLFTLTWLKHPFISEGGVDPIPFLVLVVIWSALIVLSVYDLKYKILPDRFVAIFIAASLIWFFFTPNSHSLIQGDLLGGPILFLFFFIFWFFSRGRWMGFGDAKLALGMGIFLGISQGVTATILAFWIGAVVALSLMTVQRYTESKSLRMDNKRITMKSEIPFGPFLILGTIITFFMDLNIFIYLAI